MRQVKKVYVATNGCDTQTTEQMDYLRLFLKSGWKQAGTPTEADLVILSGCSQEMRKVDETSRWIKDERARRADVRLVVTGCYAAQSGGKEHGDYEVVPRWEFRKWAQQITGREALDEPPLRVSPEDPARIDLVTGRGCAGKCTFCAIPKGTGPLTSYNIDQIVGTVQKYARDHPGTVATLRSEDTGAYGLDLGVTVIDLLRGFQEARGDYKIKLGVINPWWFERFSSRPTRYQLEERSDPDGDLANVVISGMQDGWIVPHLGLPLQSGSTDVLRLMKRNYTAEEFRQTVDRLRTAVPEMQIGTDVIVGFPGETEEDFRQTFEVLEQVPFCQYSLWGYTDMPETEAFRMEPKVDAVTIEERLNILYLLVADKTAERLGSTRDELVAWLKASGDKLPIATNLRGVRTA